MTKKFGSLFPHPANTLLIRGRLSLNPLPPLGAGLIKFDRRNLPEHDAAASGLAGQGTEAERHACFESM